MAAEARAVSTGAPARSRAQGIAAAALVVVHLVSAANLVIVMIEVHGGQTGEGRMAGEGKMAELTRILANSICGPTRLRAE